MLPGWNDSNFDVSENSLYPAQSFQTKQHQNVGIANGISGINPKEQHIRPQHSIPVAKTSFQDAKFKFTNNIDAEIKASLESDQRNLDKQMIQQQEFNELNCKQWMDNISEKISTLSNATNNIQKKMLTESDIDKKVCNESHL